MGRVFSSTRQRAQLTGFAHKSHRAVEVCFGAHLFLKMLTPELMARRPLW